VEKYSRVGEATDDNTAHENFTLNTEGYRLTIDNTIILINFPLLQWLQERTSMLLTLYIHCLSCYCFLSFGSQLQWNFESRSSIRKTT